MSNGLVESDDSDDDIFGGVSNIIQQHEQAQIQNSPGIDKD